MPKMEYSLTVFSHGRFLATSGSALVFLQNPQSPVEFCQAFWLQAAICSKHDYFFFSLTKHHPERTFGLCPSDAFS